MTTVDKRADWSPDRVREFDIRRWLLVLYIAGAVCVTISFAVPVVMYGLNFLMAAATVLVMKLPDLRGPGTKGAQIFLGVVAGANLLAGLNGLLIG
jgi:hypothetical protein